MGNPKYTELKYRPRLLPLPPWSIRSMQGGWYEVYQRRSDELILSTPDMSEQSLEVAEFITQAREALPFLYKEVIDLLKRNETLTAEVECLEERLRVYVELDKEL